MNRSWPCAAYNRFLTVAAMLMIASPDPAQAQALDERAASMRSPDDLVRWMSKELSYTMVLPDMVHTPEETLAAHTGDCDDLAILASTMLRRMGIENTVLILKFRGLSVRHAICIWKDANGSYSFISGRELTRTGKDTVEKAVMKYYPDCESMTALDADILCGRARPAREDARRGASTECAPMASLDPQLYSSL